MTSRVTSLATRGFIAASFAVFSLAGIGCGAFVAMRRFLANVWHLLAIAYLAGPYIVWSLHIPGGFELMARGAVITTLLLAFGGQLAQAVERLVRRSFAVGRDFEQTYPALQARVANGKKNLTEYLPRWVELSVANLDGNLTIFERQIPEFAKRVDGPAREALLAEAGKAAAALKDFRAFLTKDLASKPAGDWTSRFL